MTMYTAFVLAAMFLFGHRMLEFSRFSMAFTKSLLILMGSLDYKELAEEYPWTGFLWFSTFSVFLSIIMINMSLAIILDVYSGCKLANATIDPIWEQAGTA